ncbi:D-2-hydroxyacid dehydrogenase [Arthrobacter sp. EH-1B-1]|uniref:D-2-hydroxyacid dehydrogenase n=1 Tax=Arthrobacter vasquezii TaxID=2977629 RepID=A0ABT6CZC1_9MICC|nr:D-2-hydroxyacid dehydrogenase [Arthrobacter vasquezii]MDF9278369.1 D-2-hydroxyacid dehydrogenase [Arthrobacter vasquezii]
MAELRVFVPTPLPEPLCELIEELEPRIELVRDQSLLPPQLYAGDHQGARDFRRTPSQQAKYERLIDSAEALYGVPGQSGQELRRTARANPHLRWVHTTPAGGGSQVKAAQLTPDELERITFTTSGGVHAEPLAEFAVFGVLAGAQGVPQLLEDQRNRVWGARRPVPLVANQRVAVVGLGGIGRAVARKLSALGADVIGVHRREIEAEGVSGIVPPERLGALLPDVDAVVLCLPATESTHHMLSRDLLEQVKEGITVVNVGRGATVDEEALIGALRDGRVGFAALDVFEQEPLPGDSPLWELPNVLVSPHNAGTYEEEERKIAELFAENARRLLDGEPLLNVVDTVEFY